MICDVICNVKSVCFCVCGQRRSMEGVLFCEVKPFAVAAEEMVTPFCSVFMAPQQIANLCILILFKDRAAELFSERIIAAV